MKTITVLVLLAQVGSCSNYTVMRDVYKFEDQAACRMALAQLSPELRRDRMICIDRVIAP